MEFGEGEAVIIDSTPNKFVNVYQTTPVESSPTGKGNLVINKTLEGRDLQADDFEFVLKSKLGKVVETVSNDADGKIMFSELVFDKVGTYTYTVEELEKKDVERVTFDKTTYKVQAEVTDNLDGTLKVTWKVVDGAKDITFVNTYTPEPEPTLPKTGDSPLAGLLVSIVAVSAGVGLLAARRVQQN